MAKRLEVADIYPDRNAREVADKVVENLSDKETLGEAMRRWELAYMEAGGKIRPLPRGKITGK